MAHNMNMDGEHFLKEEYCFFDGKEKRCRNYTTLTASVYHPLLRKQVPLAIMETEGEDSRNVSLFWKIFQEALRKKIGQDVSFNPIGFCTDMAGANLVGIKDVFGAEALKRVKTCEFHFKQNVNKKARRLDTESGEEFKSMCEALLQAQTTSEHASVREKLDDFVKAKPAERQFLVSWLEWWDNRKEFIFRAFAPAGPKMNQAEVVHASWANRDAKNLSLLDTAHKDTTDSIFLEAQLSEYKEGRHGNGRGPTFKERNFRKEIDRAGRCGREINELAEAIDGTSKHRPDETKRKKRKQKTTKKGEVIQVQQNVPAAAPTAANLSRCQTLSQGPHNLLITFTTWAACNTCNIAILPPPNLTRTHLPYFHHVTTPKRPAYNLPFQVLIILIIPTPCRLPNV